MARKKSAYVYRGVGLRIDKQLTELADEIGIRIKPMVRDELERTYRANIYESRVSESAGTYHHTGRLAGSIYAVINGDIIKVKIKPVKYPDKKGRKITTVQVYKWLTKGTKKVAKSEYYPIESNEKKVRTYTRTIKKGKNKGQTIDEDIHWAKYTPTPKHTFNQDTIRDMEIYLKDLAVKLQDKNSYEYKQAIKSYIDKRWKGAR